MMLRCFRAEPGSSEMDGGAVPVHGESRCSWWPTHLAWAKELLNAPISPRGQGGNGARLRYVECLCDKVKKVWLWFQTDWGLHSSSLTSWLFTPFLCLWFPILQRRIIPVILAWVAKSKYRRAGRGCAYACVLVCMCRAYKHISISV